MLSAILNLANLVLSYNTRHEFLQNLKSQNVPQSVIDQVAKFTEGGVGMSGEKIGTSDIPQGLGNSGDKNMEDGSWGTERLEFPNGITNIDYIRYEARPYSEKFQNNRNKERVVLYLPMPAEINEQLEAGWAAQDDWIKKNTTLLGKSFMDMFNKEFSPKGNKGATGVPEGITEKVLNAFGGDGAVKKVMERRRGRVLNPVSEQFFTGMSHRTWEFIHKVVPESAVQAKRLDKIINRFKSASSAHVDEQVMFLNYPLMLDVKFMKGIGSTDTGDRSNMKADTENSYLPKLNTCAVTQIATNYTGAGAWARHADGAPVEVDLTISLTELVIPTAANFEGVEGNGADGNRLGNKLGVGYFHKRMQTNKSIFENINRKK